MLHCERTKAYQQIRVLEADVNLSKLRDYLGCFTFAQAVAQVFKERDFVEGLKSTAPRLCGLRISGKDWRSVSGIKW